VPVYKVKPETESFPQVMPENGKRKKRYPTVSIPVSQEILNALSVGDTVTVELKGFVQSLESRQSTDSDPYMNRTEIRVELREVEAYAGDDMEQDAEEQDGEPDDMSGAIDKALGYAKK